MFIGHIGVALALKKADKEINIAWLIGASLFLDIMLWLFVFFEIEQVYAPANFATERFLRFNFPYSHSLLASVIWSAFIFTITWLISHKKRTAWILAIAVFIHFILDWIVHVPELPLAGASSLKIGLGLWHHVLTAFFLEVVLLIAGMVIYFYASPAKNFAKRISLFFVMLLITVLAYMKQMRSPTPQYGNQVAVTSEVFILLIIILTYWLDRDGKPEISPEATTIS